MRNDTGAYNLKHYGYTSTAVLQAKSTLLQELLYNLQQYI